MSIPDVDLVPNLSKLLDQLQRAAITAENEAEAILRAASTKGWGRAAILRDYGVEADQIIESMIEGRKRLLEIEILMGKALDHAKEAKAGLALMGSAAGKE